MATFYDGSVMPPIMPDLIPSNSLANLVTQESWNAIRQPHVERTDGRCQICTDRPKRSPDCHKIWAYSMLSDNAGPTYAGMQQLISLITVCERYHEMFHLGLARARGHGTAAEARLMDTNSGRGRLSTLTTRRPSARLPSARESTIGARCHTG